MQSLSSGPFPVEFAGNGTTLYLWVSSFDPLPRNVPFTVLQVNEDGSRSPLHQGELSVPPQETDSAVFPQEQGQVLEVHLELPSPALKPSLALVGTFRADGAEQTLLWISPAGFVSLQQEG